MSLDFNYPSSFRAQPDDKTKSAGAKKNCNSTPLAAMDMRTGFNIIFVSRIDGACLHKNTAPAPSTSVISSLTYTLQGFGRPALSKSTDYETSGHPASLAFGAVELQGVKPADTVIYETGSCVVVGKDLACFEFLSSDCRALATLAASTVKFGDGDAAPIIPSNLFPACKP